MTHQKLDGKDVLMKLSSMFLARMRSPYSLSIKTESVFEELERLKFHKKIPDSHYCYELYTNSDLDKQLNYK